jgi:hypothetical protein
MWDALGLDHERVDDIPLILGLASRLRLPEILDQRLGRHHLHQGLSPGWIATTWIAYILSQADHRKSAVRDWAHAHRTTLERLIGQPIRDAEFSDDRLAILLRRLAAASPPPRPAPTWRPGSGRRPARCINSPSSRSASMAPRRAATMPLPKGD